MKLHSAEQTRLPAIWKNGRWVRQDLPSHGWTRIAVEGRKGEQFLCAACNAVRHGAYHLLGHPNVKEAIRVDVRCAATLQSPIVEQKKRTASFEEGRSMKRMRWFVRAWKRTADGRSTLYADGHRVIVEFTGRSWSYTVAPMQDEAVSWRQAGFGSSDEAKLAAFDEITKRLRKRAR
ncbi:hypothetical protein [Ralstonia chuxiongensis]|uniref:Uncharacterized protein n=1 Tax=Ralstonia chuxiongensis TaxID=2957504 RepID=A0AA41X086_9RALS|nr:hypothetical protein [Ralstonia chuxiongensis]MCP1175654.1 hypothetical protein [Ralstonia chuxiongensis]